LISSEVLDTNPSYLKESINLIPYLSTSEPVPSKDREIRTLPENSGASPNSFSVSLVERAKLYSNT
jgi:hypothetical protein